MCGKARTGELQSLFEEGNVVMTARGIEEIEFNCEFLQTLKAERAPGWVVTALCQEPGHAYPDVLSVLQMTPSQLEVTSVRIPQPDGMPGNDAIYYLCDGVEMP